MRPLPGAVRHQRGEQLVDRQILEALGRGEEGLDLLGLTNGKVSVDGRPESRRELPELLRRAVGVQPLDDLCAERSPRRLRRLARQDLDAEMLAGEIDGLQVERCQVARMAAGHCLTGMSYGATD